MALQPPRVEAMGTRRWFEPYSPPPRSKQAIKKLRSVVLDCILITLRATREVTVMALIGRGEGAVIAMVTASEDLRREAYVMRRVSEGERKELEEVAQALTHIVLLAAHVLPARSYRPLLHKSIPEIVCVFHAENTNVLAVIPTKDPLTVPGRDLALGAIGAVEGQVKYPKPAYRSPPPSPLASYQLRRRACAKLKVVNREAGRPTTVVEVFGGSAVTTQELVRFGFTGRAYECAPEGPRGAYLPEGDIERPVRGPWTAPTLCTCGLMRVDMASGRGSFKVPPRSDPILLLTTMSLEPRLGAQRQC